LSNTVHNLNKRGHEEAALLIEKKEIRKLATNEDDLISEINELSNKQINENNKTNNTLTHNTSNVNNSENHKEKLNLMHDNLITEYSDLKDFVKRLEKVKKVLTNKEDQENLNEKIQKNQNIIRFIKKLIKYTRLSLNNLKINVNSKKEYEILLKVIAVKLQKMKLDINSLNEVMDKDDIEVARNKLNKLSELYFYLKKGSIHDYIRNQLLKRIVNMNLTILTKMDIKKQLSMMKLKVQLLNNK